MSATILINSPHSTYSSAPFFAHSHQNHRQPTSSRRRRFLPRSPSEEHQQPPQPPSKNRPERVTPSRLNGSRGCVASWRPDAVWPRARFGIDPRAARRSPPQGAEGGGRRSGGWSAVWGVGVGLSNPFVRRLFRVFSKTSCLSTPIFMYSELSIQ